MRPPYGKSESQSSNCSHLCSALVHQHNPALLPFNTLQPNNALQNLDRAFSAIEQLGVPRMLDAVDLLGSKPDDKAVMAYVSLILPVLTPASTPVPNRTSTSPRTVLEPSAFNDFPPEPPSRGGTDAPPARPSVKMLVPPPAVPQRIPNSQALGT